MTIVLHHIADSRSQRVLWLLEEIGVEYCLKVHLHHDHAAANPALLAVHGMGRAPIVEIDGVAFAESGAIVEFLAEQHALSIAPGEVGRLAYLAWLHFGEASFMPLFTVAGVAQAAAKAGEARLAATRMEIDARLAFMEAALARSVWLASDQFTAADIQNAFAIDIAMHSGHPVHALPHLVRYIHAYRSRSAYRRAVRRGGFSLGQGVNIPPSTDIADAATERAEP